MAARWSVLQSLCSNIHAWTSNAGGRPSRSLGGRASERTWLPAIRAPVRRKSERAPNGLAIDRRGPRVGPTDRLVGPAGTGTRRGKTD